jgi:hypothetical protein
MSEPIPAVVLRWKRKGGRAVADAPGFLFRVEDDGAFAVQLPSGAWQHGRATDAAVAKANCAGMAQAGCTFLQGEAAALEARRREAADLAAIPPEERGFAAGVAKLLVMVAHDHIAPSEISARLPPASMREIFETLTADAEVMAAVASRTREQALRHIEDTMLGSFQSIREGKGEA